MTREFGEVLAAIAARHQAGYARVEDPGSDAEVLTAVVRRRRIVRQGGATIVGAAATIALVFGVVQGWNALNPAPAVTPTQPTTTRTPTPTPTASPTASPTPSGGAALRVLDGWTDAGVDRGVFGTMTIGGAVAADGRIVVVGCEQDAVVDGAPVGFPAWWSEDGTTWKRASGPAYVDRDQPVNCLGDVVATPYGYFAHGLHLFHSDDGAIWEQVTVDPDPADAGYGSVDAVFAVGRRVTVLVQRASLNETTVAAMFTTIDGKTWTAVPVRTVAVFDNAGVADVVATSGGLIAVGSSPGGEMTPTAAAWTSTDGLSWRLVTPQSYSAAHPRPTDPNATPDSPTDAELRAWTARHPHLADFDEAAMTAVAATSRGFVALGVDMRRDSEGLAVWWSPDGTTWTRRASPAGAANDAPSTTVNRATSTGDAVYAVGSEYVFDNATEAPQGVERPAMWRTTDGTTWQRIAEEAMPGALPFEITELNGVQYGFWPPRGWAGGDGVRVLTATP